MRILIFVLALAFLAGCGPRPAPVAAVVHARAEDGSTISQVTLFTQYEPRGRALGQVADGAPVKLISIVGQGALIETADGLRGWCNKAFILRQ